MELQLKVSDASKLRITLIGKGIVGKTSLVYSYLGFSVPQEHDPTIEDTIISLRLLMERRYSLC